MPSTKSGLIFHYTADLTPPDCAVASGLGAVRGYAVRFVEGGLTAHPIRGGATVPGVLLRGDLACLEAIGGAPPGWVRKEVMVERIHQGGPRLEAGWAYMREGPAKPPTAAEARQQIETWMAQQRSPAAVLDALPGGLDMGWNGPSRALRQSSKLAIVIRLSPPKATPLVSTLRLDYGHQGRSTGTHRIILPAAGQRALGMLGGQGLFTNPIERTAGTGAAAGPAVTVEVLFSGEPEGARVRAVWPWSTLARTRLLQIATQLDGEAADAVRRLANQLPME